MTLRTLLEINNSQLQNTATNLRYVAVLVQDSDIPVQEQTKCNSDHIALSMFLHRDVNVTLAPGQVA